MKKLIVKNINNLKYTLVDIEGNKYNVNMELYDITEKLEINDAIYMSEKLLKDINNFVSSFGALDSKYGRSNPSEDEIIIISKNGENIRLKRLYG